MILTPPESQCREFGHGREAAEKTVPGLGAEL
jgi:hypothetical protein